LHKNLLCHLLLDRLRTFTTYSKRTIKNACDRKLRQSRWRIYKHHSKIWWRGI